MTKEEAKAEQDYYQRIGINLAWYFGTKCEKCCGVYPRFHNSGGNGRETDWYECDVCGKRTAPKVMPWVAEEAWNNHEYQTGQMRFC